MALVFPSNPNVNDTYTVNGRTYVWNGTTWRTIKAPVPDVLPTLSVDNNFSAGGTLHVDSVNNEIGIGTAAPSHQLHLTQDLGVDGNLIVGGTITVPTPIAGTNDTTAATTAFVQTAVSGLVDASPATLDTLNELAAALGDDANFATTVTNSLAGKLNLTGGTLSGNVFLNTGKLLANRATATAGSAAGGIDMLIDGTTYGQIYMNSSTQMLFNASSNLFTGSVTGNTVVGAVYIGANGTDIYGTGGRNYFKDSEKSSGAGLRVGAAWGYYGIYSDDGDVVVGSNTGVVRFGNGGAYVSGATIVAPTGVDAGYFSKSISGAYGNLQSWSQNGGWICLEGGNGYLLVDSNYSDDDMYLRSYSNSGYINIGAGGSNTLIVGNGWVSTSGTITSGGDFYTNNRLTGSWGGIGAPGVQMRSGNTFNTSWTGSLQLYVDFTHIKNFVIDHPSNPSDQWLIHACSEGPTADVFYRGEAQLSDGLAVIELPDYFEDLTELEGRTIMVTPIANPSGNVANLAAYEISNGRFVVEQVGGYNIPNQRFWWRVDAVRKNTSFPVQPNKSDVTIGGDGPYRYIQEMA